MARVRFPQSITFRVTFLVSVVAVAIVCVHLVLISPQKRFFEQKLRESNRVAGIIEKHLLAEMMAGEPDNVQTHMELLRGQEGIRRVEIINPSMIVRFSSDSSRVGTKIDRRKDTPCRICHVERSDNPKDIIYQSKDAGRIFAVDHVLANRQPCSRCHGTEKRILGNLLVELSLQKSDLEALAVKRRLVLTGAVLLVVMLAGMGAIIHFMVGRPASVLLEKMSRIEAGDFNVRATRKSNDEFGRLDRGFVNMVEKLRELYSDMEAKIEERTKSLYETQAQMMHQEKLAGIGQLAAGVAHEIGNPLTAIDSMVQLLESESNDASAREKIKIIQAQIGRISDIVHSMGDLSRPLSLDQRSVNVVSVISSVIRLVKYDARFSSIKITTDFPESLFHVRTIEDRLFGAFLNLALNAADAMPSGGALEISVGRKDDAVIVAFRDTGHGITPDHLPKVFEPYFTTKDRGRGTGLGLTVCRAFFRSMGGDIEVKSEVGVGSTFSVSIPMKPKDDAAEVI